MTFTPTWVGQVHWDHVGFVDPARQRWIDAAGKPIDFSKHYGWQRWIIPNGSISSLLLGIMAAITNVFYIFEAKAYEWECDGDFDIYHERRLTNIHGMTIEVTQGHQAGFFGERGAMFFIEKNYDNALASYSVDLVSQKIWEYLDWQIRSDLNEQALQAIERKGSPPKYKYDWSSWMENVHGIREYVIGYVSLYAQMVHGIEHLPHQLPLYPKMFFEVGSLSPNYLNMFEFRANAEAGIFGQIVEQWALWENLLPVNRNDL